MKNVFEELDRALGAYRALRELDYARAEPFRIQIETAVVHGGKATEFRAIADAIDAAYRAQALANANGGIR